MTKIIDSNNELKDICERARRRAFVILDTEFVRTRTLTPLLGLIQLNDGDDVYLLDPTQMSDTSPMVELLTDPNCIKVLHACSEDLEAFNTAFGVVPSPLFDTQFAAQLLGIGTTMGYANLVENLLGIQLDKGESRTDWLARPLSPKQLEYAANDVIYLLDVYKLLAAKLSSKQTEIVLSESECLAAKKTAVMPSEFAYLQIKNNWKLRGKSLLVLKALTQWRLERARAKNMALNFVLKESVMVNIAMSLPTSKNALSRVSGITPQEVRMVGGPVLQTVQRALDSAETSPEYIPVPIKRLSEIRQYKPMMAKLKDIVNQVADETGIPAEVLSSKKQLHQVLKYFWFDTDEFRAQGLEPDLMQGWRKPLFESYLTTENLARR